MENAVLQRIKEIAKAKNLSIRAFAEKIGYNYSTLNNYLNGRRTAIGIDLIDCVLSSFDDISAEWLLRGEGDMEREEGVERGCRLCAEKERVIAAQEATIAAQRVAISALQGAEEPQLKKGGMKKRVFFVVRDGTKLEQTK